MVVTTSLSSYGDPQVWGHPTCGVCGAMPGAEEAKPGAEEAKPGVEAELQKSYSVQLHDW